MNTKETRQMIAQLSQADRAAYKAGAKSNFVTDYVRNEFIKKAFANAEDLSAKTEVEMDIVVASYVVPAVTILTKDGLYPKLLKKANFEMKDGTLKCVYTINKAGISEEYKALLSQKLDLAIK